MCGKPLPRPLHRGTYYGHRLVCRSCVPRDKIVKLQLLAIIRDGGDIRENCNNTTHVIYQQVRNIRYTLDVSVDDKREQRVSRQVQGDK